MRKALIPAVLVLCLFLGGCGFTLSLFPLYSKDVLATNDALVGKWEEIDKDGKPIKDANLWEFTKNEDGYLLTGQGLDSGGILLCDIHLVRLGDAIFLDMGTPKDNDLKLTRAPYPVLKAHTFGRIWIENDSVRFTLISGDDDLKKAEVTGKTKLPYINTEDGLVITGTTEQLQAFAREHAEDKSLFGDETNLRRKR
jgi:hypothetical protein